ncbi:hypothetical protein A7X83_11345 [Stenotrophomonas maltophilia]|uniref:Uncharacterized protein n=2 Tax=Stenotrophomonas maltophilia TaxID=40324 RepID=A0A2W6I444_STEMA|nr:hypothetical protein A7X83_11345 [Stenotrophomonas maltophilia]
MSLLPVHVLEVASSIYGMDWDPQNEDPYLAAVERLVVSQRREALGTIAQDSRPATTAADLASPKEALARRNRSRCM